MTRATRVTPALCPFCAHTLDTMSDVVGSAKPAPGDWSICLRCAGLLVVGSDLRPVKPALGLYEAACAADSALAAKVTRMRRAVLIGAAVAPTPPPTRH